MKSASKAAPKAAATKKPAAPSKPAKDAKSAKSAAKPVAKGKDVKAKDAKPAPAKGKAPPAKGKEAAKVKEPKAKDAAAAKPAKEAAPKRKRKGSGVVRLKAFWGVFNQMLKRVAVFEYAERKQADKKAADLSTSSKQQHFVQLVKEIIRDEE